MKQNQPYLTFTPEFQTDLAKIQNFIKTFETPAVDRDPIHQHKKYMIEMVLN